MAYPEDLLEQAQHLTKRERKRPKQASLRRAVSSAYYALFHLLISETVKNWKRPKERFTLARMFDHTTMSKVCTKKRDDLRAYFNTNPPPAPGTDFDRNRHLLAVTETFADMLQQRHTADYDGSKSWSRTEVSERIGAVNEAFRSWKSISDHHDAQNFLVTLLLKERKS
jgi:uncharacterized protein (UPF0332 family)